MCGGGPLHVGGYVIADLRVGDEISLAAGFGFPTAAEDAKHIIVDVSGFSAMTADGTLLACRDGAGVTPTGMRHDRFTISDKARRKFEELNQLLPPGAIVP